MRLRGSFVLFVLFAVAALGAPACSDSSHSSRCETICQREANCAEQLGQERDVDESECVEQCRRLERDPDGTPFVEAHVACVTKAPTCQAVLACE